MKSKTVLKLLNNGLGPCCENRHTPNKEEFVCDADDCNEVMCSKCIKWCRRCTINGYCNMHYRICMFCDGEYCHNCPCDCGDDPVCCEDTKHPNKKEFICDDKNCKRFLCAGCIVWCDVCKENGYCKKHSNSCCF